MNVLRARSEGYDPRLGTYQQGVSRPMFQFDAPQYAPPRAAPKPPPAPAPPAPAPAPAPPPGPQPGSPEYNKNDEIYGTGRFINWPGTG